EATRVEATYITANLEHARTDMTYRFLLDDVRVSARREARLVLKEPAAARLDPWVEEPGASFYRPGDTIAIDAESPVPLTTVRWSLSGPTGQSIAGGAVRRPADGGEGGTSWREPAAHRIATSDPPGIWRLHLDGATADGRHVETVARLLVVRPRGLPHPRLYFGASDVQALRDRRQQRAVSSLWTSLQQAAAASRQSGPIANGGLIFARLDSGYLLPSLLGYFDVLNRARLRVANNAVIGFVDDDREARAAARTALLEVCAWPSWVPPWFEAHGQHTYYPAGQLASAVALAYDVLYDDLSDADRKTVRHALLERAILPTWREYVLDNRIMANTSNWIAHTVGGAIIAAAAIAGDGTPEEDAALARPLGGLFMKIEDHLAAAYLRDGSYGEGISYQEFDLETLGPMLWAAERVFGQSYWTSSAVLDSLQYPLATLADPVSESFDTGDTHAPGGHAIASIVARSTDPVTRWYASHFNGRDILDFLFFDNRVPPRPPVAPGSRAFPIKGDVVFRTGWDRDAALVLFRAGPTFNHNHADQGSFQFRALGETLVTEAGWSDYYKDPYYDTYFAQAAGHNTLLVDGNPASQEIADTAQFAALDRYPRITDYTLSDFYDAVGSDLATVYRGRLASYTRRLAYLGPDLLVVFDHARASAAPARFTWRLHVPSRQGVTVTGDGAASTAVYAGSAAAMALRRFSSAGTVLALHDGHIPYPVFAASTPAVVPPQPAYLDVTTVDPAPDVWFLVPLVAARTAQAASKSAAAIQPVTAAGWAGFTRPRDGNRDILMFSTSDVSRRTPWEDWHTDADAWMASMRGADVLRIGAQRVRALRHGDQVLIEADRRIDVALEYGRDRADGEIRAGAAARVRIHVERRPARVLLNDVPVTAAPDSAGMIAIDVRAGSNTVTMTWGSR
ncbi:MAG TPA: heparinase II/III family protein, partial [Vicinamibacterales bacterium]|nr:heparinase II/III family protein [Vicinamibacterales bacterium]